MSFATAQGDTAAPRNLIRWRQLHLHSQLFNIQAQDIEALPCNAYKYKYKYDYVTYKQHRSGIDEILDLEKNSRGNGPFFLSRAGELNVHFSRCSRLSRFWRQNSGPPLEIRDFEENFSFSSRLNEILQTDSLLASQNFERKNSFFSLDYSLNFSSNSIFYILTSINKCT